MRSQSALSTAEIAIAPTPSSANAQNEEMWSTIQPKFWPKKPVRTMSGSRIVESTVIRSTTRFRRFDTVDR